MLSRASAPAAAASWRAACATAAGTCGRTPVNTPARRPPRVPASSRATCSALPPAISRTRDTPSRAASAGSSVRAVPGPNTTRPGSASNANGGTGSGGTGPGGTGPGGTGLRPLGARPRGLGPHGPSRRLRHEHQVSSCARLFTVARQAGICPIQFSYRCHALHHGSPPAALFRHDGRGTLGHRRPARAPGGGVPAGRLRAQAAPGHPGPDDDGLRGRGPRGIGAARVGGVVVRPGDRGAAAQLACAGGGMALLRWRGEIPPPAVQHFLRLALSTPEPDVPGHRWPSGHTSAL